jgi:hypothetical protein
VDYYNMRWSAEGLPQVFETLVKDYAHRAPRMSWAQLREAAGL